MHVWETALPTWEKSEKAWLLSDVVRNDAEQGFNLMPRDLDILDSLLKHRFLTTPQIVRLHFTSDSRAWRRMKILFEIGLIMRYRPLLPKGFGTAPFIFALTQLGYELLCKTRYETDAAASQFFREDANIVEISRIMHELELNEFCMNFLDELESFNVRWEWTPTKLCRHIIPLPSGKRLMIEQDAVIQIFTPTGEIVLHVEYERSANMRRFRQKLSRWREYREKQYWKERYSKEPYILVVGRQEPEETGGRKRRVVSSIEPLQRLAMQQRFPKLSFVSIETLESGRWDCLPDNGEAKTIWEALGLDSHYLITPWDSSIRPAGLE